MSTSLLEQASLLDRYPLKVTIPGTQIATGALHVTRHTEYVISIDDCGRAYSPRLRRFKNFRWLHDALRRLQLACPLPELPAAKAFGRFEESFVEQRRLRLEEYLKALLLLPSVIEDNTIWSFLDTDTATLAVPRFLCRPSDAMQISERLKQLKLVVQGDEIFRLCNSAVTTDLTSFVRAEAAAEIQLTNSRFQDDTKMRLQNRLLLCSVVRLLLKHDRAELARQGLLEAGLFGALLALLCRATSDAESLGASPVGGNAASAISAATAKEARELHQKVSASAQDCLQSMIERSRGAALLHFCQQDGGLTGLRKLTETETLHIVAARLLWHGLQHDGVVVALTGAAAGGLQLLGHLMGSPDLKARLLASLSIGCVAAHREALEASGKKECLDRIALVGLPAALDAEETEAVRRAVAAVTESTATGGRAKVAAESLGSAAAAMALAPFVPAGDATGSRFKACSRATTAPVRARFAPQPPASTSASAMQKAKFSSEDVMHLRPLRRTDLSGLLDGLCAPEGLARLQPLLCGGAFNHLSLLVVAVLDHFTRQVEERHRLDVLMTLAPQLRCFLREGRGGSEIRGAAALGASVAADLKDSASEEPCTEPQLDEASIHELRVRTARILVRISGGTDVVAGAAASGKDPANFDVCFSSLSVLEVLTNQSEISQVQAASRLENTREHGTKQEELVESSGLASAPCLEPQRLSEFGALISQLSGQRAALGQEMEHSHETSDSMVAHLDQFGVRHGIFKTEVCRLQTEVDVHAREEQISQQANMVVKEWEVKHSAAQEWLKTTELQLQECKQKNFQVSRQAHDLECRSLALVQRENELAETCHKAPAIAMQLEGKQQDIMRRRGSLQDEVAQVLHVIDQVKRREADIKDHKQESEDALKNVRLVRTELDRIKESLTNELYHLPEEIDKLKALEMKLQPARPSRLRRRSDDIPEDTTTSPPGGEVDGPTWDHDSKAEEAFGNNPNFRSLIDVCELRGRCWTAELKWCTESLEAVKAELQHYQAGLQEKKKNEEKAQWEDEQVRRQLSDVTDHEGHARRHAEAHEAATISQMEAQEASRDVAETTGRLKSTEVNLEQASQQASGAAQELRNAQEAANIAREKCSRSRAGVEKRCNELQEKARLQLKGWQALKLQECWLESLQARVEGGIASEAQNRAALRAEAQRLIAELHRLDEQLAVEPSVDA